MTFTYNTVENFNSFNMFTQSNIIYLDIFYLQWEYFEWKLNE